MRAVIYARFSSDKQTEASIEAQKRACEEYAVTHGYQIVGTYFDEAISGRTTNRASYQKMMKDLKKDKFDTVLIHKYDRIARNLGDHINLQQKLKEYGVRLIAVAQDYGIGKEAKLMTGMQWILSEYYVDNLIEEVRKGMKEVALKGEHNGGCPPFGYDVVNKKYVINPIEAEYVKRMYQCALDRTGYNDLLAEMEQNGIKGKRGKPISRNSIYEILHNEKYTGVYIYSLEEEKERNDRRKKPSAIRVEGAIPVIVEKETWDKVQDIMSNKKNNPHCKYKCSGLVYCKCGAKMHVVHSRKKDYEYYYYCCSEHCGEPTIRAEVIDEMVDMFLAELKRPEFVKEVTKLMKKYGADRERLEADFEMERQERLAEKQAEIDNVMANITSGKLSATVLNICNEKIETLSAEMEQIKELQPFTNYTKESVGAWINAMIKATDKELPKFVIERIDVDGEEVTITSTLANVIKKGCDLEDHSRRLVAGAQQVRTNELRNKFISDIPPIYYSRKYKKIRGA